MIVAVRRLILAVLVLALPTFAAGQSYTIAPTPFQTAFDNNGVIIPGACVWTYTAGTTNPATTYADTIGTQNTNPIVADGNARFTAYLVPGQAYKFIYENTPCAVSPPTHGPVLRTADNISAVSGASAGVDVVGTAGESILAGQAVYLSAGDGGKNTGQWYKADAANGYSSTTNWVGIATVAIASAGTGTIRIAGSVTGLTALSVGAIYYVGTAGAITSTAPANARKLGQADTATSLAVTSDPPLVLTGATIGQVLVAQGSSAGASFQAQGFFNDFRLSLATATCVTTTDVTAATTLYLTPCTGNRITLFDTSGNTETCSTPEVSIAVPATTSQLYDVWAYDSTFGTCTVTLELLAWTNDTTRATAIARSNGRWAKSGNTSRLYVGSFRTTTVSGQTEDSLTKRYVWNVYNQKLRGLQRFDAAVSWNYSTATIRQANGSTSNQVEFIVGVQEAWLDLSLSTAFQQTNAGINVSVGIGDGSTTSFTECAAWGDSPAAVGNAPLMCQVRKMPTVGRHVDAWNEWSTATPTTTFFGTVTSVPAGQSVQFGLNGWIQG